MTNEQFNQLVNRDIRRMRNEIRPDGTFAKIPAEAAEQMQREGWASMEDQREYWEVDGDGWQALHEMEQDGRSDGYGESYAERNV